MLCNSIYDDYSRSVGATWARLLFPNGFQSSEERDWGRGYELYTVSETLEHTQYLISAYYQMPYVAVDNLEIYDPSLGVNETDVAFTVPTCEISRSKNEEGSVVDIETITFDVYNSTDGWPLSTNSELSKANATRNVEFMEEFFNNLISMKFKLKVRTDGIASGVVARYNMCVLWSITVQYDLGARGQLNVRLHDEPVERCDSLPINLPLRILCVSILCLSLLYTALLVKATLHHYAILKRIHNAQVVSERRLGRRKEEVQSAQQGDSPPGENSESFSSARISASPHVTFLPKFLSSSDVGDGKTRGSNVNVDNSTPFLQSPPQTPRDAFHISLSGNPHRREHDRAQVRAKIRTEA